ncbi:MAG: hypothetical protein MUD01_04340 [Chloroflexaceae bacterium]|nr:hypothetical protein [Chloroflexaceae bacterium]
MTTLPMLLLIVIGAIAALLFLALIGWGGFWLLVQLGVIVREARRPPHQDTGSYSLSQGHEVGRDERERVHD